jgi:hypothetical protein
MKSLGDKILLKFCSTFYCSLCDYRTSKKSSYNDHLFIAKHKKQCGGDANGDANSAFPIYTEKYNCDFCSKPYMSRNGLWKHKKTCQESGNIPSKEKSMDILDKDVIMMLIKQNSELLEVVKNGTMNNNYNTTNINSHNKTFNLQFFLNETCKDAMNIMDFVDSIQLQLSDLEKMGEIGYVNGITNIIVKNLKELDITKRPVHCTDKKREIMYIKDDNKWEKEDDEKKKIRKMIKKVANKNIRLLQKFKEVHPDCNDSESSCSDQYNKIIVESMGGSGDNDVEKEDKIIRKIAKEVVIDKSKF